MKKLLFMMVLVITGIFLFAADNSKPKHPANVPEDAKLNGNRWMYSSNIHPAGFGVVLWYLDGTLMCLSYDLEGKKYRVSEDYYENGSIKEIERSIDPFALSEYEGKIKYVPANIIISRRSSYYKNGKLKESRCFTPVLKDNGILVSVLCGSEIFYDETGKEIKRIEHDVECKYGCDEIPRLSVNQVMEIIALNKKQQKIEDLKKKYEYLGKNPVIGNIVSIESSSKNIEVTYKQGFELSIGDQICFLIDGDIISFECKKNESGKGIFELKEDKGAKFSLVKTTSEPRFYKKNDVKYTEYLKSGNKPIAGDVKIIAGVEFVYIPEGDYFQNDYSNPGKGYTRHIKAFWMTKYEVTLGEYLKFSYETNRGLPDNTTALTFNSRYPAALGRFNDLASGFCNWFGYKHGIKTVLPNENEWEYAARGGTTTDYYWGNGKAADYCWYKKNSDGKLHPVGEKKPNPFGLYDIIGNTWEWCESSYLRGGSCQSSERELEYSVGHVIHYEYSDERGDRGYLTFTNQGTGIRMIIRAGD